MQSQGTIGLIVMVLTLTCVVVQAQVSPRDRLRPPPLPQLEERAPLPQPGQILPPPPPAPETKKGQPSLLARVFVREIRVTGSTVFSTEELATVTAPYINRELNSEDLEEVRLALTRYYIDRGYVTSGAILPDQTVVDGVIRFHVIEGELALIQVEGNKWFRDGYIRKRLALGSRPPVHIGVLQQRMLLLQQDARITRLNAELKPGVQRGESELFVRVSETFPLHVALEFNNYQSPTIGAEQGLITLAHQNVTGHGDILTATFGRSAGTDLQINVSYTLPLTARDMTLTLQYRRDESNVIEEPFGDLDIESESESVAIVLRQPLYRTLRREFALSLVAEHLRNENFFNGQPFSFSLGTEDGESTVAALRFAQEWTDRSPNQVIAARSRFSLGVDALGATITDRLERADGQILTDVPDGRFLAWLGQFQWARRLESVGIQTIFRLDVQLTTEALLPLEQIAVGGRFSVRGYRENQLVRDNALIVSLEMRLPLVRDKTWADVLELAPFIDFGHAWDTEGNTSDPESITSVGIGLRWALTVSVPPIRLRPRLEVYWGYPLKDVGTTGGDLQDLGLHLQFVVTAPS